MFRWIGLREKVEVGALYKCKTIPWDQKHMFSLCETVYKQLSTYQQISHITHISQHHNIELCQSTTLELKKLSNLLSQLPVRWHIDGTNGVKEQPGNPTEFIQSDGTANPNSLLKILVIGRIFPSRLSYKFKLWGLKRLMDWGSQSVSKEVRKPIAWLIESDWGSIFCTDNLLFNSFVPPLSKLSTASGTLKKKKKKRSYPVIFMLLSAWLHPW